VGAMTKLVLGSAAWRSRYGAYSKGLLTDNQIKDLTSRATALGFDFIDTAPSYGDTEEAIGRIKPMQSLATKVTVDTSDYSSIIKSIDRSRKNLGVESLELVFIHNWDVLTELEKGNSVDVLQTCTLNQSIKSWGISTYEVIELTKIEKYGWTSSRVQINSNILDQRILEIASFFRSADFKRLDCEIWVRSVFLQGVLLDESSKNPFIDHQDILKFFSFCKRFDVSPIEMNLAYIRQLDFVDRIVLGIENELHLNEISNAFQVEIPQFNFQLLESKDIELIDPRQWNLSQ
jgi:aryl-alcohol dehydrogenase-like predicted oxidoreductase